MSAARGPEGRNISARVITWRDIRISVTYEANWLNGDNPVYQTAHIQVESLTPFRVPLPITETGYRSHFIHASVIEDAGGPVCYVMAWLEHEAESPQWRDREQAARQLTLF